MIPWKNGSQRGYPEKIPMIYHLLKIMEVQRLSRSSRPENFPLQSLREWNRSCRPSWRRRVERQWRPSWQWRKYTWPVSRHRISHGWKLESTHWNKLRARAFRLRPQTQPFFYIIISRIWEVIFLWHHFICTSYLLCLWWDNRIARVTLTLPFFPGFFSVVYQTQLGISNPFLFGAGSSQTSGFPDFLDMVGHSQKASSSLPRFTHYHHHCNGFFPIQKIRSYLGMFPILNLTVCHFSRDRQIFV